MMNITNRRKTRIDMKMIKIMINPIIIIVLVCLLCIGFSGCAEKYYGTDELIEKAREEIPIADTENTEIQYAGICGVDNKAIAWFISGNEYQMHYYLPMEIKVKDNGTNYTFVRTYKPIADRCSDVAIVNWNNGYAFIINNKNVSTVRMTLDNAEIVEEVIQKDATPHTFFVPFIPSEYVFLDAEGNEVQ